MRGDVAQDTFHLSNIKVAVVNEVFFDLKSNFDCLHRKHLAMMGPLLCGSSKDSSTNLHVGDFGDGQHPADKEPRQNIIVVHTLSKPHLDLPQSHLPIFGAQQDTRN